MPKKKRGPNLINEISVTYGDGGYVGTVEVNAEGNPWELVAEHADNPIEVLTKLIVHISKMKTLEELNQESEK